MADTDPAENLETQVLEFVRREGYQPVKPRVIAKKMDLDKEGAAQLKKAIKRLVKRGVLAWGDKHLVRLADPPARAAAKKGVVGVFRRTSSGYGFVRPRGATPGSRDNDILIPHGRAGDASDGDIVVVRLRSSKGDDRRLSGEVLEIIERETHRFVGVYFERAGSGLVQVDGNLFAQPINVGDPGAKNAVPGDKVVLEMVRFPSHLHDGEAVIVEVLGARGAPGVDTLSIIREFDLPEAFAEEVMAAAREQAARFDESLPADRTDLTGLTVITIDPVDARDFDDAISLERLDEGHWRLGVHIADVSHFVPENGVLDQEARERATSVYLPDRVIPMLPEIISNHLASLQPDRVRFSKSIFIEFTEDGVRVASDLVHGAIRSCRRFTYEEVDSYLEDRGVWRERLTPAVHELLARMHELAMILRRRRMQRGAIELTLHEVKVDLDKRGEVVGAHLEINTESHQIIEEFMLAANEAVADTLHASETFFLRRVHPQPDPRKLKALTEFVTELGIPCESLESRFEIKRVIEAVRGKPEEHAVNFAVLRSMAKAVYGPEVEGHYALHSENYCHFTSPIRRYPDLVVHRQINALIAGRRPVGDLEHLTLLGEHCSEREQRAERAERELTRVKLLMYLSRRIGEQLDALITGVERFGIFVQGIELPAEGLIHISSLYDDYYRYDSRSHSLVGNREGNAFRLGDRVRVEVARVDVDRRELDFRLVAREEKGKARRQAPQSGPSRGKRGGPAKSPGRRGASSRRRKSS
ncbi:MAG: ribonuclease R [Pirellulaceae bacterium]